MNGLVVTIVIVVLCIASGVLYVYLVRPMAAMKRGMELLKAQDFSCRLAHVNYLPADRIVDTFNMMIEQLRAERLRIFEQNCFLDKLIEASTAGVVVLGFDGKIMVANSAACAMLGNSRLAGASLADIEGEIARAMRGLKTDSSCSVRLADTQMFRVSRLAMFDNGHQRPFFLIESLTDEVIAAERSIYGKLIRTMVHEVNNTLAGIIPLVETCAALSGDESVDEAARCCTARCAALSEYIGNFAEVVKIGQIEPLPTDINAFLLAMRPFLESLASQHGIEIVYDLDSTLCPQAIDTVRFEQVIVNIVKNAVESTGTARFKHATTARVTISTTAIPPALTITDNGSGISPADADKIFTPFFSTKSGGQGIGLTLSAEILRAHNFRFSLATSPTDGRTRFVIRFRG